MTFDASASNEDLKEFAAAMEKILPQQLTEADWKGTLSTGIDAISTYGTGFIFGPFVKKKTKTQVSLGANGADGAGGIRDASFDYDCPYFEHGRTMDTYPD